MLQEMSGVAKNIYGRLGDEISQSIFTDRMLYSLTGDYKYIRRVIDALPEKEKMDRLMNKVKPLAKRMVIYGAGNDLELLFRLYPDLSCVCLCDRSPELQRTGWRGWRVISPEALISDFSDCFVLISTTGFHREITEFLERNGVSSNRILDAGAVTEELYQRQYFEPGIMIPCKDEVFVDGGCYDCGTSRIFAKWCGGEYRRIYAFEPDEGNYKRCLNSSEKIDNIILNQKGLWSEAGVLCFAMGEGQGSRIMPDVSGTADAAGIPVISVDEAVAGERVTFLKLDVEGAELEALQGAAETIRGCHPSLAISIYHKAEDILTIPAYLISLSGDYRFYIRHYQLSENETILYAV